MTVFLALPLAAALLSLLLGVASVVRKSPSTATWCFFAGMAVFGLDSFLTGLSLRSETLHETVRWLSLSLVVKSFLPAAWICFSVTYSRGDARAAFTGMKVPIVALALLPIPLAVAFRSDLLTVMQADPMGGIFVLRLTAPAKALNIALLLGFALALTNLEQTFRSAVGTARWRIKYVILGLAVIFGGHLYVRSQAVLFSAYDIALSGVESSALLIGCVFLVVAYARTGLAEVDVYPSRAVLRSSVTVLIVGGYLIVVGVLAQIVRRYGGVQSFQFGAFVVLLAMAVLGVLLLSDRLRQRVHVFVGRHFRKAQHDSVVVWAELSFRLADVKDEPGLTSAAARFMSETFNALSVTVWLVDEVNDCLVDQASTAPRLAEYTSALTTGSGSGEVAAGLREQPAPFVLDTVDEPWAERLRRLNAVTFPEKGGPRWCVPLSVGGRVLGAIVLADRVGAVPYTAEEVALLKRTGDQITSVLLNLGLADEVAHARELEAFRTMSAFFVHDLKNAAASLSLTLKNLPVHFDNPAFRDDAVRAVGNTARRIDDMLARLSALRPRPELALVETDLGELVADTLEGLDDFPGVILTKELDAVPGVLVDRDHVRSVVANLLLNARDAVPPGGRIDVERIVPASAPSLASPTVAAA